jgi:hypothetical protein
VDGREWWEAVIIGAFMVAVTGSEGGGNYGRLKRGESLGGDRWGSMAWEKEGVASLAWWHERRRWRSAGAVREEEGPRGPNRPAGSWAKI